MTQRKERSVSLLIIFMTMLHVIGLAAYVYDLIPAQMAKLFFWARNDIYMLFMIGAFAYIMCDKIVKITLWTAFSIYAYYFIIVIVKNFFEFSDNITHVGWLIHFCVSFILIMFNAIYYVRSSK